MPLIAYIRARSIVPVVILAALAALLVLIGRHEKPAMLPGRLLGPAIGLCLWAAISIFWAIDGGFAIRGVSKLTGNIVLGAVLVGLASRLRDDESEWVNRAVIAGFFLSLFLLLGEAVSGGLISLKLRGFTPSPTGYFWLNSNAAILNIMVWPLAHLIPRGKKKTYLAAIFALLLGANAFVGYETGAVMVISGIVAASVFYLWRQKAAKVFAAIVAVGIMVAPLIPGKVIDPIAFGRIDIFPNAAVHRFYIWDFTAEKIKEKPLLGWGMNAARIIPGGKDRVVDKIRGDMGYVMPLHPHNFALQVWLELGFPGALLLAVFLHQLVRRLGGTTVDRVAAALYAGQFTSGLVMIGFGVGIWQSWAMVTLWFTAALGVVTSRAAAAGQ